MEHTQPHIEATDLTDEQVIGRVRAGETALFEVLMRRHNQRLFRACRAILRDDTEAEDAMQEAWVQAFAHLGDFEQRSRFSTWLTRIGVHEAFGRIRRQRRFAPMDPIEDADGEMSLDDPSPRADPERAASDGELAKVLEKAIDALPESFRVVFMLRAVEELSVAETAECLGIPEDTVKTRLFRSRALLKTEIDSRIDTALHGVHRFLLGRCDRVTDAVLRRLGARS